MCGIAGILNLDVPAGELQRRLQAMQAAIRHRGPDDAGIYVDDRFPTGLAHTRLAILDLSPAGHQPMRTDDGRYVLVFNGEIYNFRELRADLVRQGVELRSHSDTEVLLHLYRLRGPSCVELLDGMFAFAVWDSVARTCFLARDPLGIKQLYVWQHGATLAFASELRAVLEADLATRRICPPALLNYFLYGCVQEPGTLVQGVECLRAGHSLLWRDGVVETREYWRVNFSEDQASSENPIEVTRAALKESVQRHFVSDVPVGIFLSGGIDSSSLVALGRHETDAQLKTFCISFEDPVYNEGNIAQRTADHFGTEHYDWRMSTADAQQMLPSYLEAMDRPSSDGFNTYCVSKLAHDHGMKVVLSGLGGDEIFAGYATFDRVESMMKWHSRLTTIGARSLAGWACRNVSGDRRLQRIGTMLDGERSVTRAYWASRAFFDPSEARRLLERYLPGGSEAANQPLFQPDPVAQPTLADDVSYHELTGYMRNQLLRDSDVMSMAWGLELRVPMVDRKLFDQLATLPARVRLAPSKRLLIDAVPELPEWVVNQPKRGFAFPLAEWTSRIWGERFDELQANSPVSLKTWYHRWCILVLDHFLERNRVVI